MLYIYTPSKEFVGNALSSSTLFTGPIIFFYVDASQACHRRNPPAIYGHLNSGNDDKLQESAIR